MLKTKHTLHHHRGRGTTVMRGAGMHHTHNMHKGANHGNLASTTGGSVRNSKHVLRYKF